MPQFCLWHYRMLDVLHSDVHKLDTCGKLTATHLLQYTAMRVTTLHNQYHSPWEHTNTRTELPKRMLFFTIRFLVIL